MKIRLGKNEIGPKAEIEAFVFPTYVTQLINLANKNAQGTKPRVVGQMTELFKCFPGNTLDEWERWYLKQHPDAIKAATEKIVQMLGNLADASTKIDSMMVEEWVRDLVIVKTFQGLRLQKAILKKWAEMTGLDYRLAEPKEESKGVDGFIGETPVSIKPMTYKLKPELQEDIAAKIVYYTEVEDGIEVDYPELTI